MSLKTRQNFPLAVCITLELRDKLLLNVYCLLNDFEESLQCRVIIWSRLKTVRMLLNEEFLELLTHGTRRYEVSL